MKYLVLVLFSSSLLSISCNQVTAPSDGQNPNSTPPVANGENPQSSENPKNTDTSSLTELKICFLGDSGQDNEEQYLVASFLEKEGCSQVRHTGDIIYPSGIKSADDPLYQERFYLPYKNILQTTPFYLVLGNHDRYKKGGANPNAWLDVAKKDP